MCGAEYGARSEARTNRRNGYRHRDLDTRVGTLDVAVPKLREGSFLPGLADGAAATVGGGPDVGRGYLLPARGEHPADGQAGPVPRDHRAEQVAGLGDGQGPG